LGSRSYKRSRPTASPTASCGIDSRPGTTPDRLPRAHRCLAPTRDHCAHVG
jgi:hypothetical protein